jgi:bis(5'-nucleosyl)-tetraphosphatase (symmetrical)
MNRTIIYGDLHGCLDEFKLLRAKLKPTQDDNEIIIGDILDRGLYSNELLRYVREHNISSILGNHEYKYIRYKKHQDITDKTGKKNPIILDDEQQYIYDNLSDDDFVYLNFLPFFIKIDNLTLIHAGIVNKIDLDSSKKRDIEKILWIRTLDQNQKPVSLYDDINGAKNWSEYYNGTQGIIVYGHNVFDEIKIDDYSIGIDTGCVYGKKLTALIITDTLNPIDNFEIVQQKALKSYAVL